MNRPILILACCLTTIVFASLAPAEPYLPQDDDEVLETLPRELLASRGELETMRRLLAMDPRNLGVASQIATRYLQLGKQESDPRFYGYARAAIAPWWDEENPPADILRLRAKLQERDHDYDLAAADLRRLLEKKPRDVQAWVELANIYRVQGKYAESQQACDKLSSFAGTVQIQFCSVPLQIVTGHAEEAYVELEQLLTVAKKEFPQTEPWVLTMQADAALALGQDESAEGRFRAGLKANPRDYYLLRAYADFLLDHGRIDEALELVREHTGDIGVLLRAAIAARRIGETELAKRWQTELENHFEEVRLRGSQPHGQFEARYALELKDDPKIALELALANWQKQKQTEDARIILEAALAAKEPAAAEPIVEFLKQHGSDHATLRTLVQQLESRL